MTEKDYLKMIAEGDKEAFKVFFDKYYPKVLAFLQSFLQSYDDAEDVAQSVFVRLWFVRHTLVDVTRISAYLFRMTTNMAINWSKSRKTHLDLAYGDLPYQPLTEENLDATFVSRGLCMPSTTCLTGAPPSLFMAEMLPLHRVALTRRLSL